MAGVFCPNCDVMLSRKQVAEGWCETCGKKLPLAITLPPPSERSMEMARRNKPSALYTFARWMERISIAGLLFLLASCLGILRCCRFHGQVDSYDPQVERPSNWIGVR